MIDAYATLVRALAGVLGIEVPVLQAKEELPNSGELDAATYAAVLRKACAHMDAFAQETAFAFAALFCGEGQELLEPGRIAGAFFYGFRLGCSGFQYGLVQVFVLEGVGLLFRTLAVNGPAGLFKTGLVVPAERAVSIAAAVMTEPFRTAEGPVVKTEEELINAVFECAGNDFRMQGKYRDRLEAFYPVRDEQNCERTYQILSRMDGRNGAEC